MKFALAILFAALTISVLFANRSQTDNADVNGRRWEVWPAYSASDLRQWVAANRDKAAKDYIARLRLDLVFLFCFGGFLAAGSMGLAEAVGASRFWVCASLVVPLVYMATDFGEDLLLMRFLSSPDAASDARVMSGNLVLAARWLTMVKIVTAYAATTQVMTLALWALYALRRA